MSDPKQSLVAFDGLKKALYDPNFREQIKNALPKHLTPDRCLRVALTAGLKQPKLALACQTPAGKASLYQALLTASQLGLEVDGRQAHLVPFNDSRLGMIVQLIPGYQGLITLAYNHPKVLNIYAEEVYAKDKFAERKGSDRSLVHEPYDGDEDPGELRAAYAVAELDGKAKAWVVLRKREIERIRMSSASFRYAEQSKKRDSIWHTNPGPMWKKSAVRQLCKFIPQSSELRMALDKEDESDVVEISSTVTNSVPTAFLDAEPEGGEGVEELTTEQKIGLAPVKEAEPEKADLRADLMKALDGVSYDDFCDFAMVEFQTNCRDYPGYDDLPLEFVQKVLANPKGIARCKRTFSKAK